MRYAGTISVEEMNEAQEILQDLARRRRTISYTRFLAQIKGWQGSRQVFRNTRFFRLLFALSEEEFSRSKTFLSALVVRQVEHWPGSGFFKNMVYPITGKRVPEAEWEDYWMSARNAVFRAYDQP